MAARCGNGLAMVEDTKASREKTHSTYTDYMYTIINLHIIPTTHSFLVCAVAW